MRRRGPRGAALVAGPPPPPSAAVQCPRPATWFGARQAAAARCPCSARRNGDLVRRRRSAAAGRSAPYDEHQRRLAAPQARREPKDLRARCRLWAPHKRRKLSAELVPPMANGWIWSICSRWREPQRWPVSGSTNVQIPSSRRQTKRRSSAGIALPTRTARRGGAGGVRTTQLAPVRPGPGCRGFDGVSVLAAGGCPGERAFRAGVRSGCAGVSVAATARCVAKARPAAAAESAASSAFAAAAGCAAPAFLALAAVSFGAEAGRRSAELVAGRWRRLPRRASAPKQAVAPAPS